MELRLSVPAERSLGTVKFGGQLVCKPAFAGSVTGFIARGPEADP